MTRFKQSFARITTLVMAGALAFGAMMGLSGLVKASAAEGDEPATPPASGWYVVGNGASEDGLKNCSWGEYLPDFRLTGEAEDSENYLGTWETKTMLLYEGDQFKFLYANGTWQWPNDSGWGTDITGQFDNLADGQYTNFLNGGLGNIQINSGYSGYYKFTLDVFEDEGEVFIEISYKFNNTDVPPIEQYEMYVVGTIASLPDIGWPGQYEKTMLPMHAETVGDVVKYYSDVIYLVTTDEIKVYNAVNNLYYPSGINNNFSPAADGYYVIEWQQDAPDFIALRQLVED